jgi:hypothetical protein
MNRFTWEQVTDGMETAYAEALRQLHLRRVAQRRPEGVMTGAPG